MQVHGFEGAGQAVGVKADRVDPTPMTTDGYAFDDMERAFALSDKKLDDVVPVLTRLA
ncbi:hypothetical protein AB0M34_06680 [Nocardia sp. NPDC050193]